MPNSHVNGTSLTPTAPDDRSNGRRRLTSDGYLIRCAPSRVGLGRLCPNIVAEATDGGADAEPFGRPNRHHDQISRMTRAGTPTAILLAGTSLVTTLPAPMTLP